MRPSRCLPLQCSIPPSFRETRIYQDWTSSCPRLPNETLGFSCPPRRIQNSRLVRLQGWICLLMCFVEVAGAYTVTATVYRASAIYHASCPHASFKREVRAWNRLDGPRTIADGAWTFPMKLGTLPMELEPSLVEVGPLAWGL